jgi:hypothetical protein
MRGVEKRFGRDAASESASAAEPGVLFFFYDSDLKPKLAGPHRRHIPAGTRSDDANVKLFCQCFTLVSLKFQLKAKL